MKKSIAFFATVSLLSISASTFAFAETNTGKMMKSETVKMGVSSSTKPMKEDRGTMMVKPKVTTHKTTVKKPVVTITKKMDDKKTGTTTH